MHSFCKSATTYSAMLFPIIINSSSDIAIKWLHVPFW